MNKTKIEKETLEDLYVKKGLKIKDIALQLNCSVDKIRKNLQKYGFKNGTSYKPPKEKEDRLKEYKETIKTLYLSGESCSKIGKFLGRSEHTISWHLRSMGIETRSLSKMNQQDFERLWNEGKSDEEIAQFFGVTESTVQWFRTHKNNKGKFIREHFFSQTKQILSYEQEQFILGSLLGDLSLSHPTKYKGKNSRLAIVHCEKQKELFMKKVEILGEFMGPWKHCIPKPNKRTGKVYTGYRGNSKAHKIFTDIWNLLYINGIKTITPEYLNKITHPIALAYWFMDDGTFNGCLATNSFSEKEVDLLTAWLFEKWNIKSIKEKNIQNGHTQYIIRILSDSRLQFESLIFPYMVPSMYYKLKYVNILIENAKSV